MCASGAIRGAKSSSHMRSAPSSRLLVVMSPWGLVKDTNLAWVVAEKWERQNKYWSYGSRNTLPMPVPDSLVAPIQVGGKGSNFRKCVICSKILAKMSRHASSSLWVATVRCTCLTWAWVGACFLHVNIPLAPATYGVMLFTSPMIFCHFCRDVLWV